MNGLSIYELKAPTSYATPPFVYSFSSLQKILDCPRCWQLMHSEWGELKGFPERPHPAAVEGQIVHEALDMLLRKLGQCGRPPIGSARFQQAVDACGFWSFFEKRTEHWNKKLANHPRSGPCFVVRTPPRDIANRAIRLFRQQYRSLGKDGSDRVCAECETAAEASTRSLLETLQRKKAISEVKLQHPDLPYLGYIDLVAIDESGKVRIIDFKTGRFHASHEQQLRVYSVLWWRSTGNVPDHIEAQYLGDECSVAITEPELVATEKSIAEQIDRATLALSLYPAEPMPGEACGNCAVRARCDEGWRASQNIKGSGSSGARDFEMEVISEPGTNGFAAKLKDGIAVNLVYENNIAASLPQFGPGESLRVAGAISDPNSKQVLINSWTEIFKL